METGKILFLNGTSSSGKTTIGKSLHEKLSTPFLLFSVDDLLNKLPQWVFEPATQKDAELSEHTVRCVISGFQKAAGTLARSGINLIVDHVLQEEDWLIECVKEWNGLEVYFVGVKCPLDELEKREKQRGDRIPGTAAYQFNRVHAQSIYDLEVDTSILSADGCAERIKGMITSGNSPTAFQALYARYFMKQEGIKNG